MQVRSAIKIRLEARIGKDKTLELSSVKLSQSTHSAKNTNVLMRKNEKKIRK